MACRICGSASADEPITLREMMFGSRETFNYFECRDCETLQIASIPSDIGAHYPPDYYSFAPTKPTLKERLRSILRPAKPPPWLFGISKSARVLDVGCGQGEMLHSMRRWGFRNLTGYDPFLDAPISYRNGIRIGTTMPTDTFDLVMMHHSLEHVPDPVATLKEIRGLLAEDGKIVIRIPVRQGEAFRRYRNNWPHMDPPRHFYLWTVDGFIQMARDIGLRAIGYGFDGTLFSYAGGELYSNDIPLQDGGKANMSRFKPDQMAAWAAVAKAANERGDGDSAYFILNSIRP